YKTSLCDTYMANGHCGRGENCNFAHGKNDIRTRFRPPNYKTKLCKNMYKFGACPYEEKCDFIHNSSE
ncbi:hypothetical protein BX661DRAFT_128299, partial [Kickxella alabastrina]|uniref:uncharacterized protein n=1 Tax=Kickxella alabastrina TaxID=61397 RepID=UPI0022203E07